MTQKILVLFHDDEDGYASLAACMNKYMKETDVDLNHKAAQYNDPFPYELIDQDTELFILDFSYPRAILEDVKTKVKSIQVIDHHKTAMKELEGLDYCIFDMSKAGCVLAWEYFNPGEPIPRLLYHIGDRDIWKFENPNTKAICSGFKAKYDTKNIKSYFSAINDIDEILSVGNIILNQEKSIVNSFMKKVKVVNICGFRVGFLNTPTLISEIGNAMMLNEELNLDFSMSYFTTDKDVVFSFRSIEGKTKVGPLCKELQRDGIAESGGGHDHAGGAVFSPDKGLWLIGEILKSDGTNRVNWHI